MTDTTPALPEPFDIEGELLAALARAAELERKRDALREAGALMANTMFNLAQRPGEVWGADLCRSFDKMRRDWDAAVAAVPMLPDSDLRHQAQRLTPGVRTGQDGLQPMLNEAYRRGADSVLAAQQANTQLGPSALLRRALKQLGAWHDKYGAFDPAWLPPAGGARLCDDISEWLEASPISASAQQSVRPDETTPDDTTPAAQPAGRTGEHE